MPFVASPHDTEDMSYVSSVLAIEDVLPHNQDVVAKTCNKADGRCLGHRRRLFQRAGCDLLFEPDASDTVYQCNIVHNAITVQGTRHHVVALSRSAGGPHVHSAKKPSTRRVQARMNANLEVVEGGAADSADTLGDLAREPRIPPRPKLPRVLAKAGNSKQLPLETTCASRLPACPAIDSLAPAKPFQ
ncbi:hypothetical protein HPB52_025023 [Rhipicephalus sanguineus]|uniref:Uncharacterized protein n=1 Tax=Rhipicephalus sanguineus TaxID=34632 RepID=A0A9D4P9X5_RHISA|nr:hypothetical protein HPB52_025023 [Rhipicephalus sanguineus]